MIGIEAFRGAVANTCRLGRAHPDLELAEDACCNAVLKLEQLVSRSLEPLRPDRAVANQVHQLAADSQPRFPSLHAAIQNVTNVKFTGDLTQIFSTIAITQCRTAGNHVQPATTRQFRDDLVGNAVSKVPILVASTDSLEWQHRNCWPRGPLQIRLRYQIAFAIFYPLNGEYTNRTVNVLHWRGSQIMKHHRNSIRHVIA